jgi:outer membrane murein-binding lipoprotein Lpp
MSSSQSLLETILGNYRDREKKIKADCDTHDRLLKEKTRAREREMADIADKLKPKRKAVEVMMADYHELERGIVAAAMKGGADAAAMGERVKDGQAPLAEMIGAKEREGQARIEATEKLTDAAKIIRTLRAEIYQLEFEDMAARERIYAYQSYPAELQIQKLSAEIDTLRVGVNTVRGGDTKAKYDLARAEHEAQMCQGKFALQGMVWKELDVQGLRDVRLDPRLPDAYLGDLEKIIQEVGDGSDRRIDLFLSSGLQRGSGLNELTYRMTVVEGAFLETSKAAHHKAKET